MCIRDRVSTQSTGVNQQKMAAVRRANKELKNMQSNADLAEVLPDDDNSLSWTVNLVGPGDSPYSGAIFPISVVFPTDYPFKPPKVTFMNPAQIYHPNVNEEGLICLDLLKTKYSPACSMPQVFTAIHTLLAAPSTDAPLRPEIGKQYTDDFEGFKAAAEAAWQQNQ
eukprot:TRINITY_DN226_c0_g1_i2.p1 TRINITY_DN226_c0_g1~~TRINITY_DN226_c0_g1_i2.p1  ORF type:complete len:167 (+),score=49.89 TRINITY_DN226_c0_g1_i2:97-597(+)